MKKSYLLLSLSLLALVSCDSNDVTEPASERVPAKKIQLTRSQEEIRDAQTEFAFKFTNAISQEINAGNWITSPFNKFVSLSMIANGADDESFTEFRKVLQFPSAASIADVNDYNKKMLDEIAGVDPEVNLIIKNSNWLNEKCTLVDNYNAVVTEFYNAPVNIVNFDNPDQSHPIAKWFQTNTTIDIDKEYLGSLKNTNAANISYFSFSGKWNSQFQADKSKIVNFKNYNKTVSTVKMMNQSIEDNIYSEDDLCRMTCITYGNNSFDMYIFLPKGDLKDFLSQFSNSEFEKLKESAISTEVRLSLPKFEIMHHEFLNTGVYTRLGFDKLFKIDNTHKFSKFYLNPVDTRDAFLLNDTDVYLSIDENGAEAKTVTTSQPHYANGVYIAIDPAKFVEFKVDKPFYFMTIEHSSGAIVLSGAIYQMENYRENLN